MSLSEHSLVRVASRLLVVYFLFEAFCGAVELPQTALSLFHHLYFAKVSSSVETPVEFKYWTVYYGYGIAYRLFIVALTLCMAKVFSAPSARITKFFLGGVAVDSTTEQGPAPLQ